MRALALRLGLDKGYAALHVSIFLFGFTAILGRLIELPETTLVWYRVGLTLPVFWAWNGFRLPAMGRRGWARAALVGTVLAAHWVTFYAAIQQSNVSTTLVCFATGALFAAALEPMLYGGRPRGYEWALGAVAVAGVALMFGFQAQYKVGVVFGLVAAALNAVYGVLNKRLTERYSPLALNFAQLTAAFGALSVAMPLYYAAAPAVRFIPAPMDWLWLGLMAVVCTNIAYTLSLYALKRVTAFAYMLALNLESLYGIALAFLIFGEGREMNAGFAVGMVLALGGVFAYPVLRRRYG